MLENEGRLPEAEAVYRQMLVVRPGLVRTWVNLGNVAADQGRRGESETAYRRALEIAPDDRKPASGRRVPPALRPLSLDTHPLRRLPGPS